MTKTLQNVAWFAGGLIAFNYISKAIGLRTVRFYPEQVIDISWSGIQPVLEVSLIAQNTSFQSATVYSLAGQVMANGYWVGSVYNFSPQVIAPNAASRVKVYLKLNWIAIVSDIVMAFQTNQFSQEFELSGNANVESFLVPINLKFKVGQ